MSDKKIATRQSYGEKLAELGEKNENIVVLDADLSTATKTGIFAKKFPVEIYKCWNCRTKHDGNCCRSFYI